VGWREFAPAIALICVLFHRLLSLLVPQLIGEVPFPVTIFIPTPLRPFTGCKPSIEIEAPTVGEALSLLTEYNPELRNHLFTPEGKVRAFVNLYLNDEDIRYLPEKDSTAVTAADTLSIIPSIAGGSWPDGQQRLRRPRAR
jgi:adenylyltransferase/sulfurtransferase